jgi:hypothetical protein
MVNSLGRKVTEAKLGHRKDTNHQHGFSLMTATLVTWLKLCLSGYFSVNLLSLLAILYYLQLSYHLHNTSGMGCYLSLHP